MQLTGNAATILHGELQKISFHNVENGWTVVRLRCDSEPLPITAVGYFSQVKLGEFYEIQGEWVQHQSYGRQFRVNHAIPVHPHDLSGILRYLKSGIIRGIGEKTAERIVAHFGEQTLSILDHNPERLIEIPKIGKKKKQEIIHAWNERKRFRDTEIFLSDQGMSPSLISRVVRTYRDDAQQIIKENPYRLARDIVGIGFITADQMAMRLGIAPDSPQRISAAIQHVLTQAEDQGHCYQSRSQIQEALTQLLKLSPTDLEPVLEEALHLLSEDGSITFDEALDDTESSRDIYYNTKTFCAETDFVQGIQHLLHLPFQSESEERIQRYLESYAELSGKSFTSEQLSAVCKAVTHRVFVLTGGPGVGKTTTANAIIRLLGKMHKSIALAAPTGRAAQRLSEIAAIGAKTLHRLLEWSASEYCFLRDEQNPIDAQVVIIDEASMLDIHLAAALIKALPKQAQLIFIGDVDQLPSVGPGNVLRDLMESGVVPFVRLTQIFRQASESSIVNVAHNINRGLVPQFLEPHRSDCQFLHIEDPGNIREAIKELVCKTLPERGNYDPMRDIQVLTPMNRGPLGTLTLNQELQSLLNPAAEFGEKLELGTSSLRPGDKVIQTVNNYELNVFNGDIGFVEHAGFDGGQLLVNFGDRRVTYSKEDAYDLKLAYAITIHKSQGSEFPVVVIPISMQHYIMLQRNLIYTAITRARRLVVLIGTPNALTQAIHSQSSLQRQTHTIARLHAGRTPAT